MNILETRRKHKQEHPKRGVRQRALPAGYSQERCLARSAGRARSDPAAFADRGARERAKRPAQRFGRAQVF